MKLTNPNIGRVLRAAFIPKSEMHTTRIRGWHTWTSGYTTSNPGRAQTRGGEGGPWLSVEWRLNSDNRGGTPSERIAQKRAGLARVFNALGARFAVELRQGDENRNIEPCVIVRPKAPA